MKFRHFEEEPEEEGEDVLANASRHGLEQVQDVLQLNDGASNSVGFMGVGWHLQSNFCWDSICDHSAMQLLWEQRISMDYIFNF